MSYVSSDELGDCKYKADFRAIEVYTYSAKQFIDAVNGYTQINGIVNRFNEIKKLYAMSVSVNPDMSGIGEAKARLPLYVNEYNESVKTVNFVVNQASKVAEKTCGINFKIGNDSTAYIIWISKETLFFI